MCMTVTAVGMKKLVRLQKSGRPFIYGWSIKEMSKDKRRVWGYYRTGCRFRKGVSIAVGPTERVVVDATLSTGFHLFATQKDALALFNDGGVSGRDSYYLCLVKVKILVKDITAMGSHLGDEGFGILARRVEWDGRFHCDDHHKYWQTL